MNGPRVLGLSQNWKQRGGCHLGHVLGLGAGERARPIKFDKRFRVLIIVFSLEYA